MNLINAFNLLSSVSPDVARTASMLAPAQSNKNLRHVNRNLRNDDLVRRGNAACNFNLTDDFLADKKNVQLYTYAPGEAC